jgi:hypothetical protein
VGNQAFLHPGPLQTGFLKRFAGSQVYLLMIKSNNDDKIFHVG